MNKLLIATLAFILLQTARAKIVDVLHLDPMAPKKVVLIHLENH